MEARIKPLVLPEAPHYEGNTGKAPANDIEVLYADDGSVLKAEPVSIPGRRDLVDPDAGDHRADPAQI